jgi:hypothetical protein
MSDEISSKRAEILRLRARIVALERAVLATLELALRTRPEELEAFLESRRLDLSQGYLDEEFVPDLKSAAERAFLAKEVEQLMRALQSEMHFEGGISAPESG